MGLVGLLCAALGAQHVLLTDYEPQVLEHLQQNAALNGVQQRCASLRLDWRAPAAGLAPEQRRSWRRLVAADVLYASAVVQPLIATLRLLLHPEGEPTAGEAGRRRRQQGCLPCTQRGRAWHACFPSMGSGCAAQVACTPLRLAPPDPAARLWACPYIPVPHAGVALVGHQVRRAIVLDPATRLPRLEDEDEPLERFKTACSAAGLQLRLLGSRQTCSARDSDPMVLLAVGGPQARLGELPAPAPEA